MRTLLSIVFALVPALLFGNDGLPDRPYIYVQGSAELEKAPDIVTLNFDLVGRAPDRSKANDDVQIRAAKVFDMLAKLNISKNDTIADDFRTEEEFEESEGGSRKTQKVIGYVVRRGFDVKVRDVKIFPKLVDDLVALVNAEFHYDGVKEGYSKEKEIDKQLWEDAVANARTDAERTLKKAGMKIDSIFTISPVPIPEITSRMFPKGESGQGGERVVVTGSNIPTPESRLPSEYRLTPITFQQIVHVIFLISPAK